MVVGSLDPLVSYHHRGGGACRPRIYSYYFRTLLPHGNVQIPAASYRILVAHKHQVSKFLERMLTVIAMIFGAVCLNEFMKLLTNEAHLHVLNSIILWIYRIAQQQDERQRLVQLGVLE
jgi:hypothetical protein